MQKGAAGTLAQTVSMQWHRLAAAVCVVSCSLLCASVRGARAEGDDPFGFAASAGPAAASHVDVLVTRTVDGRATTLPAAAVPSLRPGDVVTARFPDYTRPPAKVNYHVDVAFVTETPPVGWLFGKSGPWDGLFLPPRARRAHLPEIRFVYGEGGRRGIPIFFIVPEDKKTRGMNGVRDYVQAHPSDFTQMSTSANDAVNRYSWFRDFLTSLSRGALDPTARQRIEAVATSLGAPGSSVDGCYAAGNSQSQIADCVKGALLSVQYQTNIDAPTQAQFFGGVATAASPAALALYLQPLLAVWQIFSRAGHTEYEYLPTTLHLQRTPESVAPQQLLMGLKVPTLRPPGAHSSVLFFTIGDSAANDRAPTVVDDDAGTGVCAVDREVRSPLHLDQTSPYVNATALALDDVAGGTTTLQLPPSEAAAPLLSQARLAAGHAYTLRLVGRYGFAPLAPADRRAVVAVPGPSQWTVTPAPDRTAVAGGTLDVIVSSPLAPCLRGAELHLAGNAPVPLALKVLDDRRVELTGSLADVPAGIADIRLRQAFAPGAQAVRNTVQVTIGGTPAAVDPKSKPTAFLGDREVLLSGSGFEAIAALRIGRALYTKVANARGDRACFTGPPVGGPGTSAGSMMTAELVAADGRPGEAFPLALAAARPRLTGAQLAPDASLHLSTERLGITLSAAAPLPPRFAVRLRREPAEAEPCDAVHDDPEASTVAETTTYRASPTRAVLTLRVGDVLHDDAFGILEAQLVDLQTQHASDWLALPGRFARAPQIHSVVCPPDPLTDCVLIGTGLAAIGGVAGPDGTLVVPGLDCTPGEKLECRSVPRLASYRIRLLDAPVTVALPAAAIVPRSAASPSPTPTSSASPS